MVSQNEKAAGTLKLLKFNYNTVIDCWKISRESKQAVKEKKKGGAEMEKKGNKPSVCIPAEK